MTNLLAAAMIVPIVGICILGVIGVVAWILLSSRDTRARTHGGPAGAAEQHAELIAGDGVGSTAMHHHSDAPP